MWDMHVLQREKPRVAGITVKKNRQEKNAQTARPPHVPKGCAGLGCLGLLGRMCLPTGHGGPVNDVGTTPRKSQTHTPQDGKYPPLPKADCPTYRPSSPADLDPWF